MSGSPARGLTVALGLLVAASLAVAEPMADLERLGRVLKSQPGWTAPYRQIYVAAGMTGGDEVEGTVWLAWPSRARFVSGQPPVRLMGLDGRRVRLVDLEVGACDEHRLDDAEWARLPLAVVLDPAAAVDSFAVLPAVGAGFVLVPRSEGGVARVEVSLGGDGLPTEVVVRDLAGSTNRLVLGTWQAAPAAPDGGFLPTPPAGVDCTADLE